MSESLTILLPVRDAAERIDAFRDGLHRLSDRLPEWQLVLVDDRRRDLDPSEETLLLSCDRTTLLRLTLDRGDAIALRAGLSEAETGTYAIWPSADAGPVELLPALLEEMRWGDADVAEARAREACAAPIVVSKRVRDVWLAEPGRGFDEVEGFGFARCAVDFEPSLGASPAPKAQRREAATEKAGRYLVALVIVGLIGSIAGILIEMPSMTLPSLALLGASLPAIVIAGLCSDLERKICRERSPDFVVERRLQGRTVVLQPNAATQQGSAANDEAGVLRPSPTIPASPKRTGDEHRRSVDESAKASTDYA